MTTSRRWATFALSLLLVVLVAVGALYTSRDTFSQLLFSVTGEETMSGQVRGGLEWVGNITRPRPNTANDVPTEHTGMSPFGVNTFLEQEVEPQKRELAVQMIADAGFRWIRQEFSWEDIEIHGKGDYEDRRNDPYRSAWEKYDHIVELADAYDLEIIARLSNPPAWSRARGDEAGAFAPPDDLEDYGDFVETVARRYGDRIRYYQVWNEPNIYPEWGERPVDPEGYTELLRVAHTRINKVCPDCVVVSGALAQTIPLGPRDLNDFVFLQRMYDAGAGDYFDVVAMQGYGLWSGPTDRRMRPRVLNFSRPLYLREIMVENGDAAKPIWITEMNWNAPPDDLPNKQFGVVTQEQQARYAVLAYQRAQEEWPWVGVVTAWFFKRATDTEHDQAMYYFRLVEPDFTPMPVYQALREYMSEPAVLYPGVHQEDDWALSYAGTWDSAPDPEAKLGASEVAGDPTSELDLLFEGSGLWLQAGPGGDGVLAVDIDGAPQERVTFSGGELVQLADGIGPGRHSASVRPVSGVLDIDSITVEGGPPAKTWILIIGLAVAVIVVSVVSISVVAGRRRWYERSRATR